MKAILYKDVPKLGDEDALVEVSAGYARNYLFPRRLAGPVTPAALTALEARKAEREKKMEAKRAQFEAEAKSLSGLEISIPADAGEGGKLFGSITSQDIALAVRAASKIEIDKKKIELSDPLKLIGEYDVSVKLYKDITASLKVKVVPK